MRGGSAGGAARNSVQRSLRRRRANEWDLGRSQDGCLVDAAHCATTQHRRRCRTERLGLLSRWAMVQSGRAAFGSWPTMLRFAHVDIPDHHHERRGVQFGRGGLRPPTARGVLLGPDARKVRIGMSSTCGEQSQDAASTPVILGSLNLACPLIGMTGQTGPKGSRWSPVRSHRSTTTVSTARSSTHG